MAWDRRSAGPVGLILGLGVLTLLAGCRSTASCKPGTVLLHVDLGSEPGSAAEEPDMLSVRVTGAGDQLLSSGALARPAGQRQGSIEVLFGRGGYPANQLVTIAVSAQRDGREIIGRSLAMRLEPVCSAISIDLTTSDAGVDPVDALPDLGQPDRPAGDGSRDVSGDAPIDAVPADAAPADDADAAPDGSEAADAAPDAGADAPPDSLPPGAQRRVFVTSTRHTGNLGGLAGANNICQGRANLAALGGTYKAWLSTSLSAATANLIHSTVPYVLVSGERVADNWKRTLTDGNLQHPIDQDERGQRVPEPVVCGGGGGEVWTNTNAAGNSLGLTDCLAWSSTDVILSGSGSTGTVKQADSRWTNSGCNAACSSDLPLYCLEQ